MISSLPTIAKAAEQIRQGELDPCDLVETCLSRIHRLEQHVRAWVLVDADGARRHAERVGRLARQGEFLGALPGIPLGIKDIIDVEGMSTEAGSPLRKGHRASRDATVVSRLKRAGAVVIGKTVTTEFACFDPPPSRNPWNLAHTPGGSSSGSAVAVSLGMCLGALGTQTGGSIIRPASYCGVAGLKPTFGHVSLDAVVPVSPRLDHAGPLARCVDDLAQLYFVMAEPRALAATLADWRSQVDSVGTSPDDTSSASGAWSQMDVYSAEPPSLRLLDEPFLRLASEPVETVTRRAVERLGEAVRAVTAMPDTFRPVRTHHRRLMAADAAAYHGEQFTTSPHAFGPKVTELIEEGLAVSEPKYKAALVHQEEFQRDCLTLFESGTLALLPATNTAAPDRLDTTGDPAFNSLWSYAGFPAVTIPSGLTDEGMPCGLQVVGPPDSELRLLHCAAWCEQRLEFSDAPPMAS